MIERLSNLSFAQLGAALGPLRSHVLSAGAIGLCAVAGLALGLVKAVAPPNAAAPKDVWKLPAIPMPSMPPTMTPDDVGDMFWSDEPRAKRVVQQKAKVINWRFVGTYAQGEQLYAIITDDKRVLRLKNGDALPDGAVIQDVQLGNLTYQQDGASKTRRLFDKDAPK
ncbi:MAG: hypothetical protein JNM81_08475 [Rhodospirillaceae bacterium]|nr:hypothetical protein [Rhodospirillaceae bacterium]